MSQCCRPRSVKRPRHARSAARTWSWPLSYRTQLRTNWRSTPTCAPAAIRPKPIFCRWGQPLTVRATVWTRIPLPCRALVTLSVAENPEKRSPRPPPSMTRMEAFFCRARYAIFQDPEDAWSCSRTRRSPNISCFRYCRMVAAAACAARCGNSLSSPAYALPTNRTRSRAQRSFRSRPACRSAARLAPPRARVACCRAARRRLRGSGRRPKSGGR